MFAQNVSATISKICALESSMETALAEMNDERFRGPLRNLTCLSFQSMAEALTYNRANSAAHRNIWLWHSAYGNRAEPFDIPGICLVCKKTTQFKANPRSEPANSPYGYRVVWWTSMICAHCHMPTLDRATMSVFLDSWRPGDTTYHVGHHSAFRRHLSVSFPDVTSSQYDERYRSGKIEDGIRYEDITSLSFDSASFDHLICMEILEHIPDYKSALAEMARVMKPGGRAILTFPWLGRDIYEHRTRAELLPDGTINHILPPQYHGDPAKEDGILSFRDFGWRILDELREAGFSKASAEILFGPLHGHMTASEPVFVAVR